jgi:hypothetical protein
MPEAVANQFMAYLATTLGAAPGVLATLITDRAVFASLLAGPRILRRYANVGVQKARATILRLLLPVPKHPIELDAMLWFKRDHGHLLPALRTKVEAHCALIATLSEASQRGAMTQTLVRDCGVEIP